MPELKPCPFCGSTKIKVDSKSVRAGYNGVDDIVYRATYSVRCNKCHARGGAVGGKVLSLENYPKEIRYALPSWATTWEEIKSKAIEAWNRRTDKELYAKIHQLGGCDASDEWSKGYDAAITEVLKLIEKAYVRGENDA